MRLQRFLILAFCAGTGLLSACATTSTPQTTPAVKSPDHVFEHVPDPGKARLPNPTTVPDITPTRPIDDGLTGTQVFESLDAFDNLAHWQGSDPRAALRAFQINCALWGKRDEARYLKDSLPQYGQYSDWAQPCFAADYVGNGPQAARQFFETYFQPVSLSTAQDSQGLLTGYYEPEIDVRRRADGVFSEAILSKPSAAAALTARRENVRATAAQIIAYGRPIDVFFMQVQGSGRLKFDDGTSTRAAFAAHNSQPYTSIGKVLVERGEMTLEEASKQSIESWMNSHSLTQVRALMNENARYVYFQPEQITNNDGPKGAMGLPLQAMGSLAVDPIYHPYGALVWLETTLPQSGGDYIGAPSGLLLSMQDTGGAIKGALRGDVFFGSGFEAGDRAGVMKHKASWKLFLPTALAMRYLAVS